MLGKYYGETKQRWGCLVGWQGANLNKAVRGGLSEKTSGQRTGGGKGANLGQS